jgi:peptidoglycan/LPS O-acetylase OafA/YrhL
VRDLRGRVTRRRRAETDDDPRQPLGLEAPAGNPRYPLFDGLRAIAALMVFANHCNQARPIGGVIGKLTAHANAGVAIFFLISGFLLYRPFVTARRGQAPPIRLRAFYGRRLLRIVPAYWVALIVLAIYPGLVGWRSHWWLMFSFGQIYDSHTYDIGIAPAWSICIEMTFYAALPLYAIWAAKLRRPSEGRRWLILELAILAGLSVLSIAYHKLTRQAHGHSNLFGTFYLFAAGMGLASVSVAWEGTRIPALIARFASWAWGFAIVAFVALSFGVSAQTLGSVHPVYAIVALALLLPATVPVAREGRASLPARVLSLRLVAWLGLISYAVYLWHQNLIFFFAQHIHASWLVFLVSAALTLTIAALSYYVVEAPFLRLKARLAGRVPGRAIPAPAPAV